METKAWRLLVGGLLALFLVVAASSRVRPVHGSDSIDYETDQVVVKLSAGVSVDEINQMYRTSLVRSLLYGANIYLLEAVKGTDVGGLLQTMSQDERLLYAELNYINSAPEAYGVDNFAWTGDDPQTGESTISMTSPRLAFDWEPAPSDSARYHHQPAAQALQLDVAHSYHQGAGVVVALLDTGVDLAHGELNGSLTLSGYDFIDGDSYPYDQPNGLDDDGDGYVDEVAGHGTHVAGIIHLVAPQAQIMALRVLDSDGRGNSFVIAEAMLYAAEHGADVINMSLGSVVQSEFMQDVLEQVTSSGVVVVAASGNLNSQVPQFPAATSCTLGVTAVNQGGHKDSLANYGVWVDLAAPGKRIFSTYPGGEYAWWSGTSMATPFVTGQVALLRGYDASLSPAQIGYIIANSATSIEQQNPGYEGQLGAGRVNVGASLEYLASNRLLTTNVALLSACGQ